MSDKRYMIENIDERGSRGVRFEDTMEEAIKAVKFFYTLGSRYIILTDTKSGTWTEYKFPIDTPQGTTFYGAIGKEINGRVNK